MPSKLAYSKLHISYNCSCRILRQNIQIEILMMSTHTHILSDLRAPYEEKYELYFILKDIIKSLK
jgi:hypothetical protein